MNTTPLETLVRVTLLSIFAFSQAVANPGRGEICVGRRGSLLGSTIRYHLFIDGEPISVLRKKHVVCTKVSAGSHLISVGPRSFGPGHRSYEVHYQAVRPDQRVRVQATPVVAFVQVLRLAERTDEPYWWASLKPGNEPIKSL